MKQVTIIGGLVILGLVLLAVSVEAVGKYNIGKKVAEIGTNAEMISITEVKVSTSTTCYVTQTVKFGAHAISCVK